MVGKHSKLRLLGVRHIAFRWKSGNINIHTLGQTIWISLMDVVGSGATHIYGYLICMKSLKIPKGVIRSLRSKKDRQYHDKRKTNKRKNNDLQHITQKRSSRQNPTKNRGWTQMFRNGTKFLLHMLHPSCYSCCKPGGHFTIFQIYGDGQVYWWIQPVDLEETIDLTNFITLCCMSTSRNVREWHLSGNRFWINK